MIEMLGKNIDYFKTKPLNIPKITILLDHGYHRRETNQGIKKDLSTDYGENQI